MSDFDPTELLKQVFIHLRHEGFRLGIDELLAALRAVEGGYGSSSLEDLKEVAQLLWCHSPHSESVFDDIWASVTPEAPPQPLDAPPVWDQPSVVPGESKQSLVLISRAERVRTNPRTRQWSVAPLRVQPGAAGAASFDRSSGRDLPIAHRAMIYAWRRLRRPVLDGQRETLDIKTTVDRAARQGFFIAPSFHRTTCNRAHLMLFFDQGGSMSPFNYFTRIIAETARYDGELERIDIYYFHNVPDMLLYSDPSLTDPVGLSQEDWQGDTAVEPALLERISRDTAVLIVSDAGSARGSSRDSRVQATSRFLEQLKHRTSLIAWLNPMPPHRWVGTSAARIAERVPMFPINSDGLRNAIDVVRGQLLHPNR